MSYVWDQPRVAAPLGSIPSGAFCVVLLTRLLVVEGAKLLDQLSVAAFRKQDSEVRM